MKAANSKNLLTLFFIILLTIVLLYLFFPQIAIYILAETRNLNISYSRLEKASFSELIFRDLGVVERKTGIGFNAKRAVIKPKVGDLSFRNVAADIDLYDFRFIKTKVTKQGAYDNLSGLVSMPLDGRWSYSQVKGHIGQSADKITVKDLIAVADAIKVSFTGDLDMRNNKVDSDTVIYFSDKLAATMPDDITKAVLVDEKDGWKSLTVHLKGDYSSPSIQVSGKIFRLNIRHMDKMNPL